MNSSQTNSSKHEVRKLRGIEIASLYKIEKSNNSWLVPSTKGSKFYRVSIIGKNSSCTCLDFETTGEKCKHIYAVEHTIANKRPVGRPPKKDDVVLRVDKRKTYGRDWRPYNSAEINEKPLFQKLLFNLCKGLSELDQKMGRPRIPISDAIFSTVFKVYTTYPGRQFISELQNAQLNGFIAEVPHFNTPYNYMEKPEVTEILTNMILTSSLPMREIEDTFAADSSGFGSCRYARWFDRKYNGKGSIAVQQDWVKAHIMCGVKTNIVTSVEIYEERTNDSPVFPSLLDTTAKNFKIKEVSGDKGYLSVKNMEAVVAHGGTPYFAFKRNSTGLKGGIWDKMYYTFCLNRVLKKSALFLNSY